MFYSVDTFLLGVGEKSSATIYVTLSQKGSNGKKVKAIELHLLNVWFWDFGRANDVIRLSLFYMANPCLPI